MEIGITKIIIQHTSSKSLLSRIGIPYPKYPPHVRLSSLLEPAGAVLN